MKKLKTRLKQFYSIFLIVLWLIVAFGVLHVNALRKEEAKKQETKYNLNGIKYASIKANTKKIVIKIINSIK